MHISLKKRMRLSKIMQNFTFTAYAEMLFTVYQDTLKTPDHKLWLALKQEWTIVL